MAVLADQDRSDVNADFQAETSRAREAFGAITKADIRATVNAIDDYFNTNAAAMNSVIPQPARGILTTAQKAKLFAKVLLKRYTQRA